MYRPLGVSSSSRIFEVMPKLPSIGALLKTVGNVPSQSAVTQFPAVQSTGRFWPTVTVDGLLAYTLRLTTRLPGSNARSSLSAEITELPTWVRTAVAPRHASV